MYNKYVDAYLAIQITVNTIDRSPSKREKCLNFKMQNVLLIITKCSQYAYVEFSIKYVQTHNFVENY